jgi:hypothetical protein
MRKELLPPNLRVGDDESEMSEAPRKKNHVDNGELCYKGHLCLVLVAK